MPRVMKLLCILTASVVTISSILWGCGSGGTQLSSASIPLAAANSPLIDVMMRVDCANGASGTGLIGDAASPGVGTITVPGGCAPPIRITTIGPGKMRPIGAKSDGSEDLAYDPAVNLPLSSIMDSLPTTALPAAVTPVTTLAAAQVSNLSAESAATIAARKTAVAAALGLTITDVDADYRNARVAAAGTAIVEVATLAASNAATVSGLPATVSGTTPLMQVIAQGLAGKAASAAENSMASIGGIATALKSVDAKLDVTASAANLADIYSDAVRVNNLVALNASTANSVGEINKLVADAAAAAATDMAAGTATAAQARLLTDITARKRQIARDSARTAGAKMVVDVSVAAGGAGNNAVLIAQAAANKIVNDVTTGVATSSAPSDLAVQAKAIAESVASAIVYDLSAATKIFATPPAVGNAGAAAALVGQLESATGSMKAGMTSTFNTSRAGADALKVVTAMKDVAAPIFAVGADQAAFQAAVAAVAAKTDPAKIDASDAGKAAIAASVSAMQTALTLTFATAPVSTTMTTTTTSSATTTTLGAGFAGLCQVKLGLAVGYVIGVTSASQCVATGEGSFNVNGGGATVTPALGYPLQGSVVDVGSLSACDPFAPPPAPGPTTLMPCRNTSATNTSITNTTTVSTTVTTVASVWTGICQVSMGAVAGYVTEVPSPWQCSLWGIGSFNVDGGGATTTAYTGWTVPAGAVSVGFGSLKACNALGMGPAPWAASLTPCVNADSAYTSPTNTTTSTTTTTTEVINFAGICQVRFGAAVAYVSGVASQSQCVSTGTGSINVDGGGAFTTGYSGSTLPAGATAVPIDSLVACELFGLPPAPAGIPSQLGRSTITPCRN